jgi:hypothetical protein
MIPQEDTKFLSSKGYDFEVLKEGDTTHIIIKGFQFPKGFYSVDKADILICVLPGYPETALDMFWVNPAVAFSDGSQPPATTERQIWHGREWQRWSRHYNWRPSVDSVKTHLYSIRKDLEKGK